MTTGSQSRLVQIRKAWRYAQIYGVGKTLFKVLGRLRPKRLSLFRSRTRDIGVIGCGQFAYSTIGYSIWRKYGNRFIRCYDIDPKCQSSFTKFYGIDNDAMDASEIIHDERVRYVYIASNHASHTDYAIEAILAGKPVYIEKPISVNHDQCRRLFKAIRSSRTAIYAGYNRPFSKGIQSLHGYCGDSSLPITLQCFVTGHKIEAGHWYRNPAEGTRICGNVGHWLDLAVHILCWGHLPDKWSISCSWACDEARDDDLNITLTSERGDLICVVLTARSEPFEGINETINFQQDDVIAKIDDFRSICVWKGRRLKRRRFWPKDVGHNAAIVQPFSELKREWREVESSTILMLFIKDMVIGGERFSEFSFAEEWNKLKL